METRKQNLEDMNTRRQEDVGAYQTARTILSQAQNVSGRTIVSYSCIPVFPYSRIPKHSRIPVFSSSQKQ